MKKFAISLMRAVALAYLPIILLLPVITEDSSATIKFPYILTLLILVLYTVPLFVAYLEVYSLTVYFLEKKEISRFQGALKLIGGALAAGTLASAFFIDKLPAVCFVLTGVLFAVLLTEWAANLRSKERFALLKDGRAWALAFIIVAVVSGIFLASANAEQSENKPDPEAPAVCIRVIRG